MGRGAKEPAGQPGGTMLVRTVEVGVCLPSRQPDLGHGDLGTSLPLSRAGSGKSCLWTGRICRPHATLAHSDSGTALGSQVPSSLFAFLGSQRELEGVLFPGSRAQLPFHLALRGASFPSSLRTSPSPGHHLRGAGQEPRNVPRATHPRDHVQVRRARSPAPGLLPRPLPLPPTPSPLIPREAWGWGVMREE